MFEWIRWYTRPYHIIGYYASIFFKTDGSWKSIEAACKNSPKNVHGFKSRNTKPWFSVKSRNKERICDMYSLTQNFPQLELDQKSNIELLCEE